ncbi:glutamate ligase domain-containing protein [Marisediminicola sp. LYQ134]|uniref:glutamate ligase domain-containing protein n=1 Tax=Marisediminicola sp. LYQ134 TaxID=3391061 RepID=UPI0039836839
MTIPGRTSLVSGNTGPRVYMDISHTPDSTEKTLAALRAISPGPLIVLLGADGDKDASKRGPMGAAGADGTVLWSGTGAYDYRVVGGEDIPYSPRSDTARALVEAGWPTADPQPSGDAERALLGPARVRAHSVVAAGT